MERTFATRESLEGSSALAELVTTFEFELPLRPEPSSPAQPTDPDPRRATESTHATP